MPPAQTIPVLDLTPEIEELWDELNKTFQRVLRSGRFIQGPEVEAFEEEVASYLGVKYAVGVNSGTDALVIGLRALGIEPGDEVITTPFSFFATAESISNVGAKPVFVDIREDSFNIDTDQIEQAITEKTRAILPVHLFGRPAEMGAILAIADKYDLKVLEDCAQSFGARYWCEDESANASQSIEGQYTGGIGDAGAFSFFPTKNLGGFGDGGMLVTDDKDVADMAKMLRAHGSKKKYHNEIFGYNSRLDAVQAALLRVKLPHIDRMNEGRRRVAETYDRLLAETEGIVTPSITKGHVFHQYTIRVLEGKRETLRRRLAEEGIGTMVYYPVPQDRLPVYEGRFKKNSASDRLATEVLSLSIWPSIEELTLTRVAQAIIDI